MKKNIYILIVILILGSGVVYFLFFKNVKTPQGETNPDTNNTTPLIVPVTKNPPTIQNQKQREGNQTGVVTDFRRQFKNNDNIQLYGTVIVFPYAMQGWGNDNLGGDALLKYYDIGGWTLVSAGGGVTDYSDLINLGVPAGTAKQLIDGLKK